MKKLNPKIEYLRDHRCTRCSQLIEQKSLVKTKVPKNRQAAIFLRSSTANEFSRDEINDRDNVRIINEICSALTRGLTKQFSLNAKKRGPLGEQSKNKV